MNSDRLNLLVLILIDYLFFVSRPTLGQVLLLYSLRYMIFRLSSLLDGLVIVLDISSDLNLLLIPIFGLISSQPLRLFRNIVLVVPFEFLVTIGEGIG